MDIFVHTSREQDYPAFIKVTKAGDNYLIALRPSPTTRHLFDKAIVSPGAIVHLELPRDKAKALLRALQREFAKDVASSAT